MHTHTCMYIYIYGFPGGSVLKNLPANAEDARDMGSIPVSERSPGGGNGGGGNTKPVPVFITEKFCGQRSLDCKELDTNEHMYIYVYIYTHHIFFTHSSMDGHI